MSKSNSTASNAAKPVSLFVLFAAAKVCIIVVRVAAVKSSLNQYFAMLW